MGMFKNLRDVKQMGEQMRAGMPSAGEQMANAQARMANASQFMAAQTQAATAAAAAAQAAANGTGIRTTVTISGMRQVGMINFDLLVAFDVTVTRDDMPPYPATTQQAVSQMQIGQIRPGMTADATIDPSNPTAVWLDLSSVR